MTQPPFYSSVLDAGTVHTGILDGVATIRFAHPKSNSLPGALLAKLAETATGSSNFVARAVILDSPPSADRNEVPDKGSINQGAVMAARAHLVEDLYKDPCPPHVLAVARKEPT